MDIENLLYEQVEKPKNHLMTKIINVYDNKYRINVYVETISDNLVKRKIQSSYFARLDDNKLQIIDLKA